MIWNLLFVAAKLVPTFGRDSQFIVPTFTLEASKPPCTFRGWTVQSDSVPCVSDSVRIVQQVAVLEISDPPLDGFAMALKL